jgi:hypothetical protein
MSLLPVSGEFLLDFPSPRHLSSSGSYPLDLSGVGDPTGSNATVGLALSVTGTHKPLYHGKVEIPIKGKARLLEHLLLTGNYSTLEHNSNTLEVLIQFMGNEKSAKTRKFTTTRNSIITLAYMVL